MSPMLAYDKALRTTMTRREQYEDYFLSAAQCLVSKRTEGPIASVLWKRRARESIKNCSFSSWKWHDSGSEVLGYDPVEWVMNALFVSLKKTPFEVQ